MMEFCKQFNERTGKFSEEAPMRVRLVARTDRTFDFSVMSPPTTWYLKRVAKVDKGALQPGRQPPVGAVSLKAIYEIALAKQVHDDRLSVLPTQGVVKSICATARSMGFKVVR